MEALHVTQSVCATCRRIVPAKMVAEGGRVYAVTFCAEHGETRRSVWSDVGEYLKAQRYVKPAWIPRAFHGDAAKACGEGCGFCERHEQHLCLPIVEITSRCNLKCPVCLVNAGRAWDMTVDEFRTVLDRLVAAEGLIHVLNLSGGEPLLHPRLQAILDEALSRREIIRVSVSTNGLRLLSDRSLLEALRDRDVFVALQFDGFNDDIYRILRGAPLLDRKMALLDLLRDEDVSTSLTMTAAGGVNEDQFPGMLECLFTRDHVSSLMIQPVALAGRATGLSGRVGRLTIPDITEALGRSGSAVVSRSDFVPLPCSHPLCFALAFYLVLDEGGAVSVSRLVDAPTLLDAVANQVFFGLEPGEYHRLRDLVYDLWSGPAASAPDSRAVLSTLRGILRELSRAGPDAKALFKTAERRVKSIFIHAFQDAETFDLARLRRCCNAYPQPDGRLIPACAHNIFHRDVNFDSGREREAPAHDR